MFNIEVCELEYLYLKGDKLVWSNDLESLKEFVANILKQQGKWLTPGGNTKQFKSSNGNVIINWYNKKHQTLTFQGRDGPALKEKLVELVQKKTDLQFPDPLVSTEQTKQASTKQTNRQTSTINENPSVNCTHERPNPKIVTDIEGLKLDLLILQKQVEENTRLLSVINIQNQVENASCAELLDCKKRCEKLLSSVSKKDNAIKELEEKCLSFESRALSLEQENDSLRLALTIIMQEKSEVINNQPRSSECWTQVDRSRGKNGNAKCSQKAVSPNITKTQNSFELLREESDSLKRRTVTKADKKRPQASTTDKRNASQVEANRSDEATQQTKREVFLAGDSILKNLQGRKMSSTAKVKISSFPGCTTVDMKDHIKPILRKNPDEIIIHVGTNSLRSCASVRGCADEIIDLASMIVKESSAEVAISGLVARSDDESLAVKVSGVNKILSQFCSQNGWGYVDHSNISAEHDLNRSGLHLNTQGTTRLAVNFIKYLRED